MHEQAYPTQFLSVRESERRVNRRRAGALTVGWYPESDFLVHSLRCRIDAETRRRYSEAQIPDLVANAIPRFLEADASRCLALYRKRRICAFCPGKCSLRSFIASNQAGLVFASSSADGK